MKTMYNQSRFCKLQLIFAFCVTSLFCAKAQAEEPNDTILIDFSDNNTSSNYAVYSSKVNIPEGKIAVVYSARYSEFRSEVSGVGEMHFYSGGERTYFGQSDDKAYPKWVSYTGDVHIYPYTKKSQNCGFYGIVLNSGGKTFNPEDIEGSLEKTNSQLQSNRVFVHEGAAIANHTGVRAARIGELNTELGSRIVGAMKDGNYAGYLIVGDLDTDATIAGAISPMGSKSKVGLVKEGDGTYRITGNNNFVNGSIRVVDGCVLLNNDINVARTEKLSGAIGCLGQQTPGVYVFEDGIIGGTGHSASIIDLYGKMQPGDNGVGTLTIEDFKNLSPVALRLRPTSKLYFEISSSEEYDRLNVSGALDYWNICEDFSVSSSTPIIYLKPLTGNSIKAGDKFTLISAKGKTAYNESEWNFRIQYPKCYTWKVEELISDNGVEIVATVTSLDYSGQGDVEIGDNLDDDKDDDDWAEWDEDYLQEEKADQNSLRYYAEKLGKQIGVATPCWSYDLTNYNLKQTKTIGGEFNMLVSENGNKYENTEPSRGSFNYDLSDKVTALGKHFNCAVRGHTFVWHKQNPSWLTDSNGTKNSGNLTRDELLAVLKNHIEKLAAHFSGKIVEWDVCNEMLSDNQTTIRSNPDAYDLRSSIWTSVIGEDVIDSAFVWANQADPSLKLILNDYGVEFKGVAKSEALYNLAKRLKNSGIPIHGVGLQCHLDAGDVDAKKLSQNIERYKDLGLECIITELDLGCDGSKDGFIQQAEDYAEITRVMMENDNCTKMVIWGLLDSDSWRGSSPLLYDSSTNPKQAYYAVRRVLRKAVELGLGIDQVEDNTKSVVSVRYYNIYGQRISQPEPGLNIVETIYQDNFRTSKKVFR